MKDGISIPRKLDAIQRKLNEWLQLNFPDTNPTEQFHGLVEEVGELAHVRLKSSQGIRGYRSPLKSEEEEKDAIGDIFIFLCNYCNTRGYCLQDIIQETLGTVLPRRWKENPETGETN